MTIHGFAQLQKKYFPNCITLIPLCFFRGKKIAIDMGMLMHTMFCMAAYRIIDSTNVPYEEVDKSKIYKFALTNIMNKLKLFLEYGIVPVCCFDSKPHFLKIDTAIKRKERQALKSAKRNKNKVVVLEDDEGLVEGEEGDVEPSTIDLETVRQLILSSDPLLGDPKLKEQYRKLLKQATRLDHEFCELLQNALEKLSIPKIHAKDVGLMSNDAEAICSMLCMKGNDVCAATYSEDSDCSVFGSPYTILEIEEMSILLDGKKTHTHVAKVRDLQKILNEIQMPFPTFVDLCILSGTDFNLNIEGIGPVNAYKLIKQYGCLENIARVKDLSIINIVEVRKMFLCTNVRAPILNLEFDKNKCKQNAREVLTPINDKMVYPFEHLQNW